MIINHYIIMLTDNPIGLDPVSVAVESAINGNTRMLFSLHETVTKSSMAVRSMSLVSSRAVLCLSSGKTFCYCSRIFRLASRNTCFMFLVSSQVVRGVYAWCQGCTHGGHVVHMNEWFSCNRQCPTGCGHMCEYT